MVQVAIWVYMIACSLVVSREHCFKNGSNCETKLESWSFLQGETLWPRTKKSRNMCNVLYLHCPAANAVMRQQRLVDSRW